MRIHATNISRLQHFGRQLSITNAHTHLQENVRDRTAQGIRHDPYFILWRNVKML